MIFLMCCWILIARILLRILASMFISDNGCSFLFFFCGIFVRFWYQGDGGLIEWVWKFTFLCNFLEEFEQDRCQLFFWQNSPVKPSCPGLLFVGRFLITVSISVLAMGLLRFSISSWFSFGRLYSPKNLFLSSKLSILLAYSC